MFMYWDQIHFEVANKLFQTMHLTYLSLKVKNYTFTKYCKNPWCIKVMSILVVELSSGGYKIRNIFA